MYTTYPVHDININNYAAGSADRAQLMKNAWHIARHFNFTIGQALRNEWRKYREAQPVYEVWGGNIGARSPKMVRCGLTLSEAKDCEYLIRYSYDLTTIRRRGEAFRYPFSDYDYIPERS